MHKTFPEMRKREGGGGDIYVAHYINILVNTSLKRLV